jgi:transposase
MWSISCKVEIDHISVEQYEKIKDSLPLQRGNVRLTNLQVVNAILYVPEQGCKWRGLPKRFGNWHTIYVRMNRWAKNGVLDRVFDETAGGAGRAHPDRGILVGLHFGEGASGRYGER